MNERDRLQSELAVANAQVEELQRQLNNKTNELAGVKSTLAKVTAMLKPERSRADKAMHALAESHIDRTQAILEAARLRGELDRVTMERDRLIFERHSRSTEHLISELEEYERSFALRHRADMRAIEKWRAGHPERELRQPDHADLCTWLLDYIDELEGTAGKNHKFIGPTCQWCRGQHLGIICDRRPAGRLGPQKGACDSAAP